MEVKERLEKKDILDCGEWKNYLKLMMIIWSLRLLQVYSLLEAMEAILRMAYIKIVVNL
ncbi:hypothetical protein LX64_04213 [Chitinophaga skermanii]|uniref:Uncharacterized protein n=1 Tax=Chitinophaga skermanii TaxID=331697 RepID=A0A327Q7D4_9BACT|nr:hypothetical protein LX64_04213 [Chitinophaga skermanii]